MGIKRIEILIVEDSRTQAAELMYILDNNGYSVQHAINGGKALEMLNLFEPKIIISDIVMPDMDGYQLCSILKADDHLKDIPIILLTSLSDPQDVMKGLESGADGFLVKPYDEKLLLARIRYFLQNAAFRSVQPDQNKLEILFADQKYNINSTPRQVLDILLSTYENSVLKNKELIETNRKLKTAQDNLSRLNASLEEKVKARTQELENNNQRLLDEIDERKKAEQSLIESEANVRAIMESTSDSIILLDEDGTVIDTNEGHAKRFGTSRKDMLGENIFNYLPEEITTRRKKLMDQVIATGVPAYGDDLRDGRWTEFSIFPVVKQNGEIENVAVYAHDITEERKAQKAIKEIEEIFRQFLEHSPVYVFFKDEKIRSIHLSRNFETMLGKPLTDLIGKSMDELFPSDLAKKMVADDLRIFENGEEVTVNEDFNGRNYTTIKFPIKIEGKAKFLAGFTIDVTEQKEADRELKENEERLMELNATKDKFFSILAHDLKTPFSAILGFSKLLVEQVQSKDYEYVEEFAGHIYDSSHKAMDLLMNLLEWSRSQTGKIAFKPELIKIDDVIKQSIDLLSDSAEQKKVTICTEVKEGESVFGDKEMIKTILRNLVSNAIKFSNPDGKITISTEQNPNENVIKVSDTGVGISPESFEKLFRIDQNNSTMGTQNETGTGLGLILCKEFVEEHGGQIGVESEVGTGSTFYFTLPKEL